MIGYSLVNIKGQITIPADIRKKVGINPQDRVVITHSEDGISVKPVYDIFSLRGSVSPKKTPEDFKKMSASFRDYLSSRKAK